MDLDSNILLEFAKAQVMSLDNQDRFECLLQTLAATIPCDAIALLALERDVLKPLAIKGLTSDTLGRRFIINDNPRFKAIIAAKAPMRFEADCPLPDPYDGLVANVQGDLPIHACMGLPLYFAGQLIGVLTFDSLKPQAFSHLPQTSLDALAAIAAATLKIALTLDELEYKNAQSHLLVAELNKESLVRDGFEMIGQSQEMAKLKQELTIVAASPFSVLIQGETGVGKELVAKSLHMQSARANHPLVYVNCAALPENLIESELFGHKKGAFTGADKDRAGKFALADGGTLFLDEIGELPLAAQSKLLRALQSNEIQPVGQDKIQHVDVRVIAATNRDLIQEVEKGVFRSDLYHRLSVYPIKVPALKNRIGDIELLTGYFLELSRRKLGLQQLKLAVGVIEHLNSYDWPGNVRELEHVISRAALKAAAQYQQGEIVQIETLHLGLLNSEIKTEQTGSIKERAETGELQKDSQFNPDLTLGLKAATEDFQRQAIVTVLNEYQGNWSAAARVLKADRANLTRLAKRLGISVTKQVTR
ncbi:nitric oxide reductase transcriptional regulator NorR [Catenovulum sp. SM1970]|uniref:nitric oxide reductase transcriptional regulator NorR n=1 Tax=Marinifaba aquimaris TaxID=2741323 RepID=UPI001572D49B|nr:nitric oxide reductase transcriptional regulator NorR [Marinifaba aquimaris]NTS76766.1 nitric oxide reductase transcriptional regulator NorR [Marinifaba aquimaris]